MIDAHQPAGQRAFGGAEFHFRLGRGRAWARRFRRRTEDGVQCLIEAVDEPVER
jgi:hypothetical protein